MIEKEAGLSEQNAGFLAGRILMAVKLLQDNGLVHRDIKPENVVFDSELVVKITDFGFGKDTWDREKSAVKSDIF